MANKQDPLGAYRGKRDLGRTTEPSAGRKRRGGRRPRFVVHQHDATTLHYDFRLEAAGVLKSWAVPKGPSTNPKDKRLAMPTEDHPMAYGSFEGVIPEGEYGAGPVIVWDTGTFRNLTERNGDEVPMAEALERGHAKFWLEGSKLRGGYALTRTPVGGSDREKWLLVKLKDDQADARRNPVSTQRESVVSGLTIDEMRAGRSA
jgi:DNA ligase D-like protein (predicted 3'-phosphoesterase)